ncbi:GNAT family N-acetyltransferase [Motilimonas sp. E26]|uniref:tRNA(Met) cytidine acetyltransferase TmcA n=1 Tax=Motilimonas sp. E26 TaxID=2865674 RepID=UPI001E310AB4|nr:GNAT family N-acetyltransferase [Motilimonas sp. E26]MCE0556562.1 GNAT family N-acetyltransferase [Motilimonas sp. E26]
MNILPLVNALIKQAQQTNHRRLLILSGEQAWAHRAIVPMIEPEALFIGAPVPTISLPASTRYYQVKQAHLLLGQQCSQLIIDAYSGLSADALGALSGTLIGGGILILICPPLDTWPSYQDPDYLRFISAQSPPPKKSLFLARLVALLRQDPSATIVEQGQPLPSIEHLSNTESVTFHIPQYQAPYKNQEQADAVASIHKVSAGRANRPLILTADRGRGKSAALGIAAAQLLAQEQQIEIALTAPSPQAVQSVFELAQANLPAAERVGNNLNYQGNTLTFFAPDQLILEQPKATLLLIDEAAALPIPLLQQLNQNYKRVVFCSTLHGYEGSGRGFSLKFIPYLQRVSNGYKQTHLKSPIRWAEDDPVEALIFNALLLDAQLPSLSLTQQDEELVVRQVMPQELSNNEALLRAIFSLLVCAHYQTKPSDLRALLDNPGIQIMALQQGQGIIGAAIICSEGQLSESLSQDVYHGQRRIQGHLIPQSLLFHGGQQAAGAKHYARIMRIAIHPSLQQQGLGSYLVKQLSKWASGQGYDFLGSSFGLTLELGQFWQRLGFQIAHLGLTQDSASGCYSALMLMPLTAEQAPWLFQCQERLFNQLGDHFCGPLKHLPPELACFIINSHHTPAPTDLIQDIQTYVQYHRPLAFILPNIKKWLIKHGRTEDVSPSEQALLARLILQQQDWANSIKGSSYSGKKEAEAGLKACLQRYLE